MRLKVVNCFNFEIVLSCLSQDIFLCGHNLVHCVAGTCQAPSRIQHCGIPFSLLLLGSLLSFVLAYRRKGTGCFHRGRICLLYLMWDPYTEIYVSLNTLLKEQFDSCCLIPVLIPFFPITPQREWFGLGFWPADDTLSEGKKVERKNPMAFIFCPALKLQGQHHLLVLLLGFNRTWQ